METRDMENLVKFSSRYFFFALGYFDGCITDSFDVVFRITNEYSAGILLNGAYEGIFSICDEPITGRII